MIVTSTAVLSSDGGSVGCLYGTKKHRIFWEFLGPKSVALINFGVAGEPGVHRRVKKYSVNPVTVDTGTKSFFGLSSLDYAVELCFTDNSFPPKLVCSTAIAQDEITVFYASTCSDTRGERLSIVLAVPTKLASRFERDIVKMAVKID